MTASVKSGLFVGMVLLKLIYAGSVLGIHQEAHCGKDWITFQVIAYKVGGGKLKPTQRTVTHRKSDIEFIFVVEGSEAKIITTEDVGTSYYVRPESREAILRCLDMSR